MPCVLLSPAGPCRCGMVVWGGQAILAVPLPAVALLVVWLLPQGVAPCWAVAGVPAVVLLLVGLPLLPALQLRVLRAVLELLLLPCLLVPVQPGFPVGLVVPVALLRPVLLVLVQPGCRECVCVVRVCIGM